jgi:hypothetical protein
MKGLNSIKIKIACFVLLLDLSGIISAQSTIGGFLPKYPVKSANIQYKLTVLKNWGNDTFSTLIVNYTTKRDYGQTREEGKRTIYIRDNGKASAQEWEGTTVEYNHPPEKKHINKIRDSENEWQGVFMKVKQYTCIGGPDQYQLIGEETATTIRENTPIADSIFEYPEDFSRN